jgi:RsiW-degrading membrane proteinase PrsW (M82 family)
MTGNPRDPQPFPLLQWFAGLALCILIFFAGALNIFLELPKGGVVPFLLTTLAAFSVVPFYALLILFLDRHEREPGWLLLAAFFWGAAVATLFAGIANTLLHALFRALLGPKLGDVFWPPLAAPLTEETAKGLVVLLIAAVWRHEFHNTLDGIVYGALAGLGFAAVENVSYFLRALEQGGLAALGISFYVRALLGGLSHSAYTACTGAGIGYAREAKTPAERVTAPLVGYFLAMFLHFAWNFTASVLSPVFDRLTGGSLLLDLFVVMPLTVAVLEGPAWVTLLLLAHLAWKQERSLIASHLQDEPEDVVRKEELPLLLSPLRRFRLLWQALGRSGVRQWADLRALFDLLADFAFARHDVAQGRRPAAELDRYRARIRELRRRLGTASLGKAS